MTRTAGESRALRKLLWSNDASSSGCTDCSRCDSQNGQAAQRRIRCSVRETRLVAHDCRAYGPRRCRPNDVGAGRGRASIRAVRRPVDHAIANDRSGVLAVSTVDLVSADAAEVLAGPRIELRSDGLQWTPVLRVESHAPNTVAARRRRRPQPWTGDAGDDAVQVPAGRAKYLRGPSRWSTLRERQPAWRWSRPSCIERHGDDVLEKDVRVVALRGAASHP